MLFQQIPIGAIVKLKRQLLHQPAGTLGVVYEDYSLSPKTHNWDPVRGISVITEHGEDLGGFSQREQDDFLELVCHTEFRYRFINVMRLMDDWNSGVFRAAFQAVKQNRTA